MNAKSRQAIGTALNQLNTLQRTRLTKQALEAALEGLPEAQADEVQALARALSARVNKMGDLVALEVLAAIGMHLAENGARL